MALLDDLRAACAAVKPNEPLSSHTTLAIGGPADYFAEVFTGKDLTALRQIVETHRLPVFFLGAGSNLLVSDQGIRGLVLHLVGDFRKVDFAEKKVTAGAGVWMPTLVKHCAERGLSGIESLIGVPGSLGGGLVMNAGTREGTVGEVVESVDVLDAEARVTTLSRAELRFEYRRSNLEGRWILAAVLGLKAVERSIIMNRIDELLRYRARTQPIGTSNCGSVFKNPPGQAAAKLVEEAGFKGMRCGGAQVSERHANFIVNDGRATARDVWQLIEQIQKTVFEKFGVRLDPEIKRAGEW